MAMPSRRTKPRLTLGNGKATLETLLGSQAIGADSAHLVYLGVVGASSDKIGTTSDLPDRPNHLR